MREREYALGREPGGRRPDAPPPVARRIEHPLLRLQRSVGNAAVLRLLAVARSADGEAPVAPEVESRIERARGGGRALDSVVRAGMERAFDADFSAVRVHTDREADGLNRSLSARAFATGQDVFFRSGEFDPGSSSGRELLAHELTHVVQQGEQAQTKLVVGSATDPAEHEADEVAHDVVRGQALGPEEDEEELRRQPEDERSREEEEEEETAP